MAIPIQPASPTIDSLLTIPIAGVSAFDAAVAYVRFSGVQEFLRHRHFSNVRRTRMRFLVGIDYCRSEPSALDVLSDLSRSNVRIVDGRFLVSTRTCCPRRTYHPKAYLIVDRARKDLLKQLLDLNLAVAQAIEQGKSVTAPGVPASHGAPADLITDDSIRP